MNGKERTQRILKGLPVDRIGLFEHFWTDTHKAWTSEGHFAENESFEDHFGFVAGLFGLFIFCNVLIGVAFIIHMGGLIADDDPIAGGLFAVHIII